MLPTHIRRIIATTSLVVTSSSLTNWLFQARRQSSLNHALIDAIKRSDADAVEFVLGSGADPNTRCPWSGNYDWRDRLRHEIHPFSIAYDMTALMCAVTSRGPNAPRIARALLKHGAAVHAHLGERAEVIGYIFSCSSVPETVDLLSILLDAGANVDERAQGGDSTILALACSRDNPAATLALVQHGANLEFGGFYGETPLMEACMDDQPANMRILLEHGAKPQPEGSTKSPPLLNPDLLRWADNMWANRCGLATMMVVPIADCPPDATSPHKSL